MSVPLKRLYSADGNPFRLELAAGANGAGNVVNWIYMLEDEDIISYFHGSELTVTTGKRQSIEDGWLLRIVQRLYQQRVAGLIVNTGMYVQTIPQPVLDFCNEKDFPLLTMPWEIHITDMTQSFCISIMNNRQESLVHDQAIRDAVLHPDKVETYQEVLSTYYDLDEDFTVITIAAKHKKDSDPQSEYVLPSQLEYWLESKLRRLKRSANALQTHMGVVEMEHLQMLIVNRASPALMERLPDVILDAYQDVLKTHNIYIGIGQQVMGITEIYKSFQRAVTAMQIAVHRKRSIINFQEMGFDKILFSVKDEQVLSSYADEVLGAVEKYDAGGHEYMKLLRAYIHNDRSLEGTAKELFLHRNTVNYQIQKLRTLVNSPLKTAEELFPFQVALAIRDM